MRITVNAAAAMLAPTGAGPVDDCAYRRDHEPLAGLPGGVPPPERIEN